MYNYLKFVHYSDVERAVKTSTTSRFYLSWFVQTDGKPNMTVPHYLWEECTVDGRIPA